MVSDEEQWKKILLGQHRAVAFIMLNTDSSTSVKIVTKLTMVLSVISDLFIEQVTNMQCCCGWCQAAE